LEHVQIKVRIYLMPCRVNSRLDGGPSRAQAPAPDTVGSLPYA
jgi:hypothetical protein